VVAVAWRECQHGAAPACMILTKHFVLLHFPRTGGVFFRRMCQQHLPPDWELRELRETHAYHSAIPEESVGLPTICFLRNPWDWYVSWYEFTTQFMSREGRGERPMPATNPWFTLFGGGTHDFRQTVLIACTRDEGKRPWELAMREWDCDLYSAMFWLMTGHAPSAPANGSGLAPLFPRDRQVETGQYESFREDFEAFVERNEIPAPRGFMYAIRNEPPRHQSERRPYHEYYDDELRDLVGTKARRLIDQYEYEF
jgi:hypothetical protein